MNNVEVDQESDATLTQLQVAEQLCLMKGKQSGYGLEFDDDCVLNEQLNTIACLDFHVPVHDGKHPLLLDLQPPVLELISNANPVSALEKPGAQGRMNSH